MDHGRMYERLKDQIVGPLPADVQTQIVPFVIDDAAQMFFSDPKEYWPLDEFPALVPPFEYTWMEYETPRYSNREGELVPQPVHQMPRVGCFLSAEEVDDADRTEVLLTDPIWQYVSHTPALNKGNDQERLARIGRDRMVNMRQAAANGERARFVLIARVLAEIVGTTGRATRLAPGGLAELTLNMMYLNEQGRYIDKSGFITSYLTDEEGLNQLSSSVRVFMFACSLLACRNVQIIEQPEVPAKVARRRHEKDPHYHPVCFKTLDIRPLQERVRQAGGHKAPGGPVQMAFHEVRGGFRTYDESGRLFGRWTGTWYWHPQLRGSLRYGAIVKDYRVRTADQKGGIP